MPLVPDINLGQPKGNNALHMCAESDSAPAAEILLRTPGVDINAKCKGDDQSTPTSLAA